ncbi:MAG TPA: hypothetical protein PKL84_09975 [Candidatus Hydrogenedentes bacterium]|nr:hypothetical protein [Candidatus Hydrogenedentota bacterium]
MKRREFVKTISVAGAALGLAGRAEGADQGPNAAGAVECGKPSFRDVGWVWEGQGVDPGVPPSIYGLGQGARYFGLSRANFLFHPNDVHALRLFEDYDEVTCDITKWGWEWNEDGRPACKPKSDPVTVRTEGENVARLAKQFENITGVYCDDLLGLMKSFEYGPKAFGEIRSAIRNQNPNLRLWTVVYTHEFEEVDFWTEMRPHIDVVTLWIWKSENIDHMSHYVEQCQRLFPGKPIVMGVYLRDYTQAAPVPVDQVRRQMEGIAGLVEKKTLSGYSILAAVLIDGHRPQADAVRDFIAAQSG